VGSNPASRATYAERKGLPETEALFHFRHFLVAFIIALLRPAFSLAARLAQRFPGFHIASHAICCRRRACLAVAQSRT
jgi:hypothetical protein